MQIKTCVILFVILLFIGITIVCGILFIPNKTELEYRDLIKQNNIRINALTEELDKQRKIADQLKSENRELSNISRELTASNRNDIERIQQIIESAGEIKSELNKGSKEK